MLRIARRAAVLLAMSAASAETLALTSFESEVRQSPQEYAVFQKLDRDSSVAIRVAQLPQLKARFQLLVLFCITRTLLERATTLLESASRPARSVS
jgi:hypothetical protein